MRGYKALCEDMTSAYGDFVFEVGKTYEHDGPIRFCQSGFHFCANPADCFEYYDSKTSRLFEIEADGDIVSSEFQCVCSQITLLRELDDIEKSELLNIGRNNSGHWNTGDDNSGWWNTGDNNSDSWNCGDRNCGDLNAGSRNTGDCNSGSWNCGCGNSGDWNSGDWNATNHSSGVLCTKEPECLIFDKPSGMTLEEWRKTDAANLMLRISARKPFWRRWDLMTEDERTRIPEAMDAGGIVMYPVEPIDFAGWWDDLTEEERDIIKAIPNFDAEKWKLITGIVV